MLHFDSQPFCSLFNNDENVASLAQFQRFHSAHRFLGRYWVAKVPGLRLRHIGLLPVSQLCDVLPFAVSLLSVMPAFEGVLLFSDFDITTTATISPLELCNRHTKLRILRIEGELSGDVGRARILLHLQHASHWFHDERWDIFTLVGGDADSFGDAEFGRGRRPQGGFTRIRLIQLRMSSTYVVKWRISNLIYLIALDIGKAEPAHLLIGGLFRYIPVQQCIFVIGGCRILSWLPSCSTALSNTMSLATGFAMILVLLIRMIKDWFFESVVGGGPKNRSSG